MFTVWAKRSQPERPFPAPLGMPAENPCFASFRDLRCRLLDRVGSGREHGMLSLLITRLRFCSVITVVLLYAACAVLHSVALAIPRSSSSSHCHDRQSVDTRFQDSNIGSSIRALHDSAIHEHAGTSTKGGVGKLKCHAGGCCGCFAAITGNAAAVAPAVHGSLLFRTLDASLDGCGPERIGWPPKSFLSL